jgi:hypothetical protein
MWLFDCKHALLPPDKFLDKPPFYGPTLSPTVEHNMEEQERVQEFVDGYNANK